jgi:hypothetical protein
LSAHLDEPRPILSGHSQKHRLPYVADPPLAVSLVIEALVRAAKADDAVARRARLRETRTLAGLRG